MRKCADMGGTGVIEGHRGPIGGGMGLLGRPRTRLGPITLRPAPLLGLPPVAESTVILSEAVVCMTMNRSQPKPTPSRLYLTAAPSAQVHHTQRSVDYRTLYHRCVEELRALCLLSCFPCSGVGSRQ